MALRSSPRLREAAGGSGGRCKQLKKAEKKFEREWKKRSQHTEHNKMLRKWVRDVEDTKDKRIAQLEKELKDKGKHIAQLENLLPPQAPSQSPRKCVKQIALALK